jgi:glycogen operon protein
VLVLRRRQRRNFLTTLFISQGTPMLLGGDEMGRTQRGNNNPWCQDNEISWYDWTERDGTGDLREFTRRLIRLRREHPVFRRQSFLRGTEVKDSGLPDVWWFRQDGLKMTRRDWQHGEPVLGMFLNGRELTTPGPRGEDIEDDSFLVLFNAHHEDRTFMLPRRRFGAQWALELSTSDPNLHAGSIGYGARTEVEVISRSLIILKRVK